MSDNSLKLKAMMDKFENSSFGFKIDKTRMHVVGFSSGGFMASRMAFSYPGIFKSLTSLGGGYYNCLASCPEDYEDSGWFHFRWFNITLPR